MTAALRVEWAAAHQPAPYETESGDQYVVQPLADGLLLGVIDGLGHGSPAATAALLAVQTLRATTTADLPALIRRCHAALSGSRGAVLTLAHVDTHRSMLAWAGIGNVAGVLVHPGHTAHTPQREHLHLRGGVVGYNLPHPRVFTAPVAPGDVLVLATDGIRSGFSDAIQPGSTAQTIADHLLAKHIRGTDDALVLVVVCHSPA